VNASALHLLAGKALMRRTHMPRSHRRSFAFAAVAVSMLLSTASAALTQDAHRVEIETIRFKSDLIGRVLPYNVLLPPSYFESNRRYPALYLLHGLFGRYDDWVTRTNLAEYAAKYHIIIITPEGHDSWYTDSASVPTDKYESYLIRELIPDVDTRFRTIKDRHGRGIAGLSMGGYGALKYALKYPDQFAFAGSLSGVLDAATRTDDNPEELWQILRPSINAVYGPKGSQTRSANDLVQIARNLNSAQIASLPYLYLDCGTEDGFLGTNRAIVEILLAKKIPHQYRQLPGVHNWEYWDRQVREVLRVSAQSMRYDVEH
jgi:putative tributyrin esterase